ncbi:MAG TPA: outer membrane beta-barrel protein [Bacteroidota bacterium]|nr:outer membrane beta-barrel protein [Bacteroidota bacterium]
MKHRAINSFLTYVVSIVSLFVLCSVGALAQETKLAPEWWFGGALGANINFYRGDIQFYPPPNPFPLFYSEHISTGTGVGLFVAPLIEYTPVGPWGGFLQLGFDGRGGKFDESGGSKFSMTMNYLSVEPAVRYTFSGTGLYAFLGPCLGFNISKSYTRTPSSGPEVSGDFSDARGTALSAQLGAGYDIPLSNPNADLQSILSPFVSGHVGQPPIDSPSWKLITVRAGVALKFGTTTHLHHEVNQEVQFSLKAPKIIPNTRRVKETFPMRNDVFFDLGSNEIPTRYQRLNADEAKGFTEERLLEPKPEDLTGRSHRQLTVYYNLLNVLGDRLRRHATATVTLTGSALEGANDGKALAESVKKYLVSAFGIDGGRITTEGRERPEHPSSEPGGTRDLDLVHAEDRRVDISSVDPKILQPVQIISLQEDPLDSDVIFSVEGAQDVLSSWSLEVTGDSGKVEHYGPFTSNQERISGKTILGARQSGRYMIALVGETKGGQSVRKEETMRLARSEAPEDSAGSRFSILFEFDQSKTVATYDEFLRNTVAPLIPEGGAVVIHGHTDIIGEESHNLKLSQDRAQEAMRILEDALAKAGKRNVKFDTYGFGADPRRAPFENRLPEERFYNRTVIIDIVPEQ